jgi:hypothetical protein
MNLEDHLGDITRKARSMTGVSMKGCPGRQHDH